MTYFASALRDIMDTNGITGIHLSKQTGLAESNISRLRNADKQRVDHDELRLIVNALDSPKHRAQLLLAHLEDERAGLDVGVTINGPRGSASSYLLLDADATPLPPLEHDAMDILRQNILNDEDLRAIILNLAKLFRRIPNDDPPDVTRTLKPRGRK